MCQRVSEIEPRTQFFNRCALPHYWHFPAVAVFLWFLPTPNPRHRRDKIRTCRIVRWDIALAVALVGLPGGDIVTESDIQTAAIGIKCGYQRRLLVRRLPCRVLLTMVARCHH